MRVLFLALICWAARACSVEGVVFDSYAGRPLAAARVVMRASFSGVEWVARTGIDGRFTALGLEADKYAVHLEKAGYVLDGPGAAELDLHAACEWKGLVYRMVPSASLAGRLRDRMGEPVRRAQVQALVRHWTLGGWSFVATESAFTDDRGDYRMAVRPGERYALRYRPGDSNPGYEDATEVLWVMIPTLFPGTTISAEAGMVETLPSRDYRGLDFSPLMAPVLRIEGQVTSDVSKRTPSECAVVIRRKDEPGAPQENANYDPKTGEFSLGGLSPGDYEVLAYAAEEKTVSLASQTVSIRDRDLRGVSLRLEAPFTVRGVIEGPEQVSRKDVQFDFRPYAQPLIWEPAALVNEDGGFELTQMMRERGRLRMTSRQPGVYLKAVRVGEEEMRGDLLDWRVVREGVVRVMLAADGGAIEGWVPGAGYRARVVVAAPEDRERRAFFLLPNALARSTDGGFRLQNLAPGQYRLYAFEVEPSENATNPLLFGEPGWLEQAPGEGVKVLVVPGATARAEVPLMRRP